MLRTLSIRDVVIVTCLEIDFSTGFNVFSGETGAGKSILLDALSLTLGDRADASIVREGCARADVCAEFSFFPKTQPDLMQWLEEHAFIEPNQQAESEQSTITTPHTTSRKKTSTDNSEIPLLLRRVVDNKGRSKGFINGIPATMMQLREVGHWLVDIHGQHAHQLLLKPHAQRQLFDHHAELDTLVAQVQQRYEQFISLDKALTTARAQTQTQQQRREQLVWQLDEFDKIAPQTGEWQQLQIEHARLAHAAHLIEDVQSTLNELDDADDAALSLLTRSSTRIRQLAQIDTQLGDMAELLDTAIVQVQEVTHSLNRYAQQLELDPTRLETVNARLQALLGLARKHKVQPDELAAIHAQYQAQLEQLTQAQDFEAASKAVAVARAAYMEVAQTLSEERHRAAKKLSQTVTQAMQTLAMVGGFFEVALPPLPEGGAYGLEQVEFLVAGHAGVHPRPLAKVASGGELARISLALSVITSTASLTPTLVFDEVDAGIGGAVAEIVGKLLRQLGTQRQVLCVTHLAQVAALGHQHFRVSKHSEGKQTQSHIAVLDQASRIEEIARMLGGKSETARQHAEEMLPQEENQ